MATPSRMDNMIRTLIKSRKKDLLNTCDKQFQDCPAETNKEKCGVCPFYKKC